MLPFPFTSFHKTLDTLMFTRSPYCNVTWLLYFTLSEISIPSQQYWLCVWIHSRIMETYLLKVTSVYVNFSCISNQNILPLRQATMTELNTLGIQHGCRSIYDLLFPFALWVFRRVEGKRYACVHVNRNCALRKETVFYFVTTKDSFSTCSTNSKVDHLQQKVCSSNWATNLTSNI